MQHFAAGAAGSVGLLSGEPPLSPETIGRAPSNFDAPVPVIPLEELVRLKAAAVPAVAATPAPAAPAVAPAPIAVSSERRRVVVRLVGGDDVELASFERSDVAVEHAHTLVAQLSAAERGGTWPEVAGRHLRPAAILSVDVVLAG
jgi:hypothetical protein